MQPISKENKRTGIIIALIVHLFVFLFLIFTSFDTPKQEDKERIVAVMDFSGGGGSAGGSESTQPQEEPTQESEETESSDSSEEVVTQETESPAESSSAPASKNENNSSAQEESKKDPKYGNLGNVFGKGNGKGDKEGNGDGGSGGGTGGGNGPSVGSGDGIGDGKGRILKFKPDFVNPTQETGKVIVAITINRDGKVIKAVAKPNNSGTTTSNVVLLRSAEKQAKQLKFNAMPNGPKYDQMATTIRFTLN